MVDVSLCAGVWFAGTRGGGFPTSAQTSIRVSPTSSVERHAGRVPHPWSAGGLTRMATLGFTSRPTTMHGGFPTSAQTSVCVSPTSSVERHAGRVPHPWSAMRGRVPHPGSAGALAGPSPPREAHRPMPVDGICGAGHLIQPHSVKPSPAPHTSSPHLSGHAC